MAAKPIEAHQWDFPWGYCPCGFMVNCTASDIDIYVADVNHKDPRYAKIATCGQCHSTRMVRVTGSYRDWERIHMNVKRARLKKRDQET